MRTRWVVLLLGLCLVVAGAAHAEVQLIMDTNYGDGGCGWTEEGDLYTYHYTVWNNTLSDAVMDQVILWPTVAPESVFKITGPTGWYAWGQAVPDNDNNIAFWGIYAPPTLTPDQKLTGFTLSAYQSPGIVNYGLYKSGQGTINEGTIIGPEMQSGTPEPASLCLLGLTIGPLFALRRRKQQGKHPAA